MLCDECKKVKATVHLTEIINEQITKLNLCEQCAKDKGSDVEQHFGIADLLSALSDAGTAQSQPGAGSFAGKVKCQACGMTYDDFKKVGRLGCSECYISFKAGLAPLLKRIHGSVQHMGKTPNSDAVKEQKSSSKLREDLEKAKDELHRAIKKEEFEEAAAIRDKIKFLEKKLKEAKP